MLSGFFFFWNRNKSAICGIFVAWSIIFARCTNKFRCYRKGHRFKSLLRIQSNCLICLPDKSGIFVVFGAETAQNTLKQAKTGFGMAIIARPRPAICVFEPKIPRTFYFKLTEQSSRKKLAVGGFEPEKVRLLYPAPLKKPLLSTTTREVFSCI